MPCAWPVEVFKCKHWSKHRGKSGGTNTSYEPDHTDKQDHLCFHLCIHLNHLGGNNRVDKEGLNTSCILGRMVLLCQASC